MEELVRYLAKSLVQEPDQVDVKTVESDKTVVLELRVAPDDMGRVIGKQGRIAKSIRTVVKAAASKGDKKVIVDIK
ncbi:MAG: KH domain-containing protein [Lachnospiraceae bacterium]|nr:KH domain-containing protein [Lachnospiraceae bacterium]